MQNKAFICILNSISNNKYIIFIYVNVFTFLYLYKLN